MSEKFDQNLELNNTLDEYINSPDPDKHKKYARAICFILTYLPGARTYSKFLGENKLNKDGAPGLKVRSGFMRLIKSHKKKSRSDSLYAIRKEVMDCFHDVELNYLSNSAKGDLVGILEGFKKLDISIEQSINEQKLGGIFSSSMVVRTYNGLKAAKINSIGDLFENYGGEWREKVLRFRGVGTGVTGVIDKIIEDSGLDVNMSTEEYKLLKKLSARL